MSILSEKRVKSILPGTKLQQSLRAEKIPVKGTIQVQVQYGQQRKSLTCYVVKGDGPCLMGLKHIRLNWKEIGVTMLDNTQCGKYGDVLSWGP